MNKIFKILSGIVVGVSLLFINTSTINAASASISVTSGTSKIVIGKSFTVTTKISSSTSLGSWEWVISYDTSKFKLVSGTPYIVGYSSGSSVKSKSYSYTFKAIGTGTGTITVKSYGAYAWNESKLSVTKSTKSVKVITQAELEASYSKDNNLSSLSVEGYTLSPTFSSKETEYKVNAGSNTQSVKVNAKKSDSEASVSGLGNHEVTEGENKIVVTVTAENGSVKKYTIIVNVTDPNPIEVTVNNEKYVVVKRESNLVAPEGYVKKEITINEQKIPSYYSEINNYILVGLKNSNGDIELFIYKEETNTYTPYREALLDQIKLTPLKMDKTFGKQYSSATTIIDEVEFESLKIKNSEYSIIHAKDLSTGEDNYYLYDEKTNSIVRYTDEETTEFKEKIVQYEKIIILLSIETCIIFIVLVCILIAKVRKNKKRRKYIKEETVQKELEEKEKKDDEQTKKKEKKSSNKK